jgi:peptidoglycan/LPS O-acetylase OafA/YrhL
MEARMSSITFSRSFDWRGFLKRIAIVLGVTSPLILPHSFDRNFPIILHVLYFAVYGVLAIFNCGVAIVGFLNAQKERSKKIWACAYVHSFLCLASVYADLTIALSLPPLPLFVGVPLALSYAIWIIDPLERWWP